MLRVQASNVHIYNNLAQAYEAEFSQITGKVPDRNGMFPIDTVIDDSVTAYIDLIDESPIGIAAVKTSMNFHKMCEFYIIPSRRKMNYGNKFAHKIFDIHKGHWQIKQISGAEYASSFWRKTIISYGSEFIEDTYHDDYWGIVIRQQFIAKDI
jgi:predicted acetyltransferase